MLGEALEQLGEVMAGEVPGEGLGDFVVVALELVECPRDLSGVLEVGWLGTLRWMIE